jgi:2-methylisocitrate lyase-like PEP mutase family enzyme
VSGCRRRDCGHTRGKQVIPRNEARMKIRAAVEARSGADILIMARTDARAVHGFDEALARCRDFEAEGADIIFLEAPETEDEMRRFCRAMQKPCMANLVPGGKTPISVLITTNLDFAEWSKCRCFWFCCPPC